MIRKWLISSCFVVNSSLALMPARAEDVRIFMPEDYHAHPRNFSILQHSDGDIFAGNAYGIVQYNGSDWFTIGMPNGLSAYCLTEDTKGTIWAGSISEIGMLVPLATGRMTYKSLSSLLPPKLRNFGYTWKILWHKDKLYVFNFSHIFSLDETQFYQHWEAAPGSSFQFATLLGEELIVYQQNLGYYILGDRGLIHSPEIIVDPAITPRALWRPGRDQLEVIHARGTILCRNASCLNYDFPFGQSKEVAILSDKTGPKLVIATPKSLEIYNARGRLQQKLDLPPEFAGNKIHDLTQDREGGIWLATDIGIWRMETMHHQVRLDGKAGVYGIGYSSANLGEDLFLGTSKGLFKTSISGTLSNASPSIECLVETGYEIWNIHPNGGQLILSCAKGIWEWEQGKWSAMNPVQPQLGAWKFMPLRQNKNIAVCGTYEGMDLYEKKGGRWIYKSHLAGYEESARIFEEDERGNLWVCHGNKGLFRLSLDLKNGRCAEVINENKHQGMTDNFFSGIVKDSTGLLFISSHGVYSFNYSNQRFEKASYFSTQKSAFTSLQSLKRLGTDEYLLFADNKTIYLNKHKISALAELNGKAVGSYEFGQKLKDGRLLVATLHGFTLVDIENRPVASSGPEIKLFQVSLPMTGDHLLSWKIKNPKWEYHQNHIKFRFTTSNYSSPEAQRYRYYLGKQDTRGDTLWSPWTAGKELSLASLHEGSYLLLLQSKDASDQMGNVYSYTFQISPPWYRTSLAYLAYGLTNLLLILGIYRILKVRYHRKKKKLQEEQHQKVLALEAARLKSEHDLVQLRNEKLQADLQLQNTELAALGTALAQKNEFLATLKEKVIALQKGSHSTSIESKEINGLIDKAMDFGEDWLLFEAHFDKLNNYFLQKLRKKHPQLSPDWLLLCAYLKMKKSNKEIASLLSLSPAAVDKRRYRLKEKLGLGNDQKLMDYLQAID